MWKLVTFNAQAVVTTDQASCDHKLSLVVKLADRLFLRWKVTFHQFVEDSRMRKLLLPTFTFYNVDDLLFEVLYLTS